MHFDLSKPQHLLAQSARDFCRRKFPPERVRELMETDSGIDNSLWTEIVDQGWIGPHLSENYDGLGLGLMELAVIAEELGRSCVSGPWLATNWAATLLAEIGGTTAQEHLPSLTGGATKATVGAFEDQGAWEFDSSDLQTTLSGDGRLSGGKDCVLHAADAEFILCPACCNDELVIVLIPGSINGLRIEATPGIDATRRLYRCDFENVRISGEQILASGDAARSAWERTSDILTVVASAELLGVQQWMLDATVEYAKTRSQFDRPIGTFQAVQHMCADMLLMTESARSAVWYAAWAVQENTDDARKAVSVAKAYTSDAATRVADLAVQSHGGIGFTWEHDLHLYYKRAKASEYLLGDGSFHRERLVALTLDL